MFYDLKFFVWVDDGRQLVAHFPVVVSDDIEGCRCFVEDNFLVSAFEAVAIRKFEFEFPREAPTEKRFISFDEV